LDKAEAAALEADADPVGALVMAADHQRVSELIAD
jgi:hypothetical protein